jgi:hypothetical protein
MAIPAKDIGRLLAKDLDEAFRAVDYELRTTWAVYAEFNHEHMRYDITEIVPWGQRYLGTEPTKIVDAIDEMDAYKKFIEGHK